jgi:hypothetical protein
MTRILSAEQKNTTSEIQPEIDSPINKNSKTNTWITLGIIICVIVACTILCEAAMGIRIVNIFKEKTLIQTTILKFMKSMEAKDINSAYSLLFNQENLTLSDLEKYCNSEYYVFDGIEKLTMDKIKYSDYFEGGIGTPPLLTAYVNYKITYKDGRETNFYMELVKSNEWMIDDFNIMVSPKNLDNN